MRRTTRAGWFAVTALVTGLAATAFRFERVVGGAAEPSLAFDVDVPHEALAAMSAEDIERAWRGSLREYDVVTTSGQPSQPDAAEVRVTVIGADRAHADDVLAGLTASTLLELVFVRDGDHAMARWHQAVERRELPDIGVDVEGHPDFWRHDQSGREFFDMYLRAPTEEALDKAVDALAARYPLPEGTSIAYERVEPHPQDEGEHGPYFRTYLVEDELILSNEDVAEAAVTYDPNTLLPEVMVTLTDAGAERFGDATAANVGRKLAILLDGRVASAPVIQAAIRGGRVSITMGGSDPMTQEREATTLAGVLGSRVALPPGIQARLVITNDRPMGVVWALRLLAAILGGVLAVFLATFSERRRWLTRAPSVSRGAERWDALALPALVTFLVPILLWAVASQILLPGINAVELGNVIPDPSFGAQSMMGVLSLGLKPLTIAFALVELYAILVEALVPSRRGRRLGTPADRRRLDRASWVLVGVFALVQSYFFAQYLQSMSSRGAEVWVGGKGFEWVVVVTLAAGVMVNVIAAETISRHGLCNGYLVVLASGAVIDLAALLVPAVESRFLDPYRPATLLLAAIAAIAAFATVVSTRVRTGGDGPRLPYTGVVPASLVRGGFGVVALAAFWSPWLAAQLMRVEPWTPVLELAATAPLTALILLSTRRAWTTPGIVATLAFLAVLVLLPFTVAKSYRLAAPFAEGVLLGVVAAELWVGALARVRIPDAVSVLVVHDVDRADRAADRLAAAGIPNALLGVRARAALRFLIPFAPIAVRVPAARAAEAAALLDDVSPPPAPPA